MPPNLALPQITGNNLEIFQQIFYFETLAMTDFPVMMDPWTNFCMIVQVTISIWGT